MCPLPKLSQIVRILNYFIFHHLPLVKFGVHKFSVAFEVMRSLEKVFVKCRATNDSYPHEFFGCGIKAGVSFLRGIVH